MRSSPAFALLALMACASAPGCIVHSHSSDPCADDACNTGTPAGPIHGKRADGRVDVTAAQAWPARSPEPPPLDPSQLARACVTLGSCLSPADSPATLIGLCTLPDGSEERAIPEGEKYERRSWELARALAGGSCDTLLNLTTKRDPDIYCEEDGCWWSSASTTVPHVSCSGDVATLVTNKGSFQRDCSHAFQRCDPTSPTGCSDRRPVACDAAATDRCDGDIKLGCDHSGRVSFHDCARVAGGRCEEHADGSAACVYPDGKACTSGAASTCTGDGSAVSVCVGGEPIAVDCASLGYTSCAAGRCVK